MHIEIPIRILTYVTGRYRAMAARADHLARLAEANGTARHAALAPPPNPFARH
jgi:hypothetical protein